MMRFLRRSVFATLAKPGRSSNVTCTRVRSTVTSPVNGIGVGLSSSSGMSSASVTDGGVFFDFSFSFKSVKSDCGASAVRGTYGPSENRPRFWDLPRSSRQRPGWRRVPRSPSDGRSPRSASPRRAPGEHHGRGHRPSTLIVHLSRSPTAWRANRL